MPEPCESSPSPVPIAEDISAYGVALDLPGDKAYVTDVKNGKVIELDLSSEPAQQQQTWSVARAAGIALDGGKAYVSQYGRDDLYEIDLEVGNSTPLLVATILGRGVRVALDGAGHAYVCDWNGQKLHEVVVADGEAKGRQRVVADRLGRAAGLGLDLDNGRIYVSNHQGQLLRISGVLPDGSAES